jgi:hypothetical protein
MGIRGDIDESDRDLNRDMYPNRGRSNRFGLDERKIAGGFDGHLRDFYAKNSVIRKDGYGGRNDDEFYADFTPKDINGTGKYIGKGPRNYTRSSDRIQDDICRLLTDDRALDASFIDVDVIGDEVHLAGFVDSRLSRWRAEDLAAEVPGVTKIINQLKIRHVS